MRTVSPEVLARRARLAGLTLVEVMIAMTIGLLILAALSGVLVNNLRTGREIEQVGRHVEDGRFAVQIIVDELSNAGFYGGASTVNGIEQKDFCEVAKIHEAILTPSFAMGSVKPACADNDMKPKTQWLGIRRYTTNGKPSESVPSCPEEVTCVQIDSAGKPVYSADDTQDVLLHDKKTYAAVHVPVLSIYYVDTNNRLHRIGLEWADNEASTVDTVLVEGVEMLRFENEGQGVRINLLARAENPTHGMKAESKTYLAFESDGEDYVTNDKIRRSYYSVVANIYNP